MSTTESSATALDPMNVVETEILHHDRSIDWEIVCSAFALLHVRNAYVNSAVIRTFFIIFEYLTRYYTKYIFKKQNETNR